MGEPELLVQHELRLHGCRIATVERRGAHIVFAFVAADAEAFLPGDDRADPDGWVRGLSDVVSDGAIGCLPNEEMMGRWQAALERWRDDNDLVEIELDFVAQTISHYNPRTRELIRVEHGGQDDPNWTNPPLDL